MKLSSQPPPPHSFHCEEAFDASSGGEEEMLGAQKWLVGHACCSTSSGVEIHLELGVSRMLAKATSLGGRRGGLASPRMSWSQGCEAG